MFRTCKPVCTMQKSKSVFINENLKLKSKKHGQLKTSDFAKLVKTELVFLENLDPVHLVTLDCEIKRTYENFKYFEQLDVKWNILNKNYSRDSLIFGNGQFLIDNMHRLLIYEPMKAQTGIYQCYLNGKIRKIIYLQQREMFLYKVLHGSRYLGCFSMILLLFLITVSICFKNK